MLVALPVLLAYLLGAIPFALVVSRLAGVGDIRRIGSGNVGATNVWRAAGFKVAVWVFVGDIGKGALAVLVARYFATEIETLPVSTDLLFIACALAAIIGHVFPVYLGFKGGKGVNTALGAFAILMPLQTLTALGVFLIMVLTFRYISLGSIVGAFAFFCATMVERFVLERPIEMIYVYLSAALVVLIVLTHRDNISRLLAGTENRFSFSSRGGKHSGRG